MLRKVRRHPLAHWAFIAALATVSAGVIASVTGRADAVRRAWGDARPVAVATRHVDAGQLLGPEDVTVVDWPASLVPSGALDSAPVGRAARVSFERGEPFTATRVAPDGVSGLAALVPTGWRAVAIAVGDAAVPLEPGDVVDLLASSVDGAVTGVIAEGALVLQAGEQSVTVALPKGVVARVAGALASGAVIPVLRPASEDPMPR